MCASARRFSGIGSDVYNIVIASEAKQSIDQRNKEWIASSLTLLAMTAMNYSNPTDTFPSTPKSTAQKSPAWIGSGGWQVPVVTIRFAFNVTPSWRNSLASQVSASLGSPSTFLP